MYRAEKIAEQYTKDGLFKPEIVAYGNQILYEMEMDKRAMVTAIMYLTSYLEYRSKHKAVHSFGDHDADLALQHLVKRVLIYSCPNPLKEHLRTPENCPAKSECTCFKK